MKKTFITSIALILTIGINAQTFDWAKSFGGSGYNRGNSITVDASGNVYTTGYFVGTGDFDPGAGTANLTSAGLIDIFVQKLDASGNFLWAKSFGGNSNDVGNSITVDASGNVYITGYFDGIVDFDPGAGTANLTSAGGDDIFVQKLDASGNFIWAKSFGGAAYSDVGNSITVDASGNVYTTGVFNETVDFDPGGGTANLTSAGLMDIFVQKLNASGNFIWAKSFGGASNDLGNSITVDASGNVYTTGFFYVTGDFDPGAGTTNLTSVGGDDIFVQKLDASGNFIWAKSFGTTDSDVGNSITVDALGNVYTSGHFSQTIDFDPGAGTTNLTSVGINDIFVQKMSLCIPTTGSDIQAACDSYTWIDGNTYTSSNNTATHILTNAAGCDSVVTLNLTINNFTTGTDTQTACHSFTWIDGNTYTSSNNTATHTLTNTAGCDSLVTLSLTINSVSDISTSLNEITIMATNSNTTYQWLDCDNNNAEIVGETGQTFTAIANGNYAVELTENGCVDTSVCVAITTVGITENSFGSEFIIYPNPTSGKFSIDLGDYYENTQILIADIFGKIIRSQIITKTLNLSIEDPAGVYIVSIQAANKIAIIRLVKE